MPTEKMKISRIEKARQEPEPHAWEKAVRATMAAKDCTFADAALLVEKEQPALRENYLLKKKGGHA